MVILSYIGYIMIALLLMSMLAKARPEDQGTCAWQGTEEHSHGIAVTLSVASFKSLRPVDRNCVWRSHWLASIELWLGSSAQLQSSPCSCPCATHSQPRAWRLEKESFTRGRIFRDLLPKDRALNSTTPLYLDDLHCSSSPPKWAAC